MLYNALVPRLGGIKLELEGNEVEKIPVDLICPDTVSYRCNMGLYRRISIGSGDFTIILINQHTA